MGEAPDREEVDAKIEAAVAPVLSELKWHRWLLMALVAAVASPKLGGPDATNVAAILFDSAAQAAGFPGR